MLFWPEKSAYRDVRMPLLKGKLKKNTYNDIEVTFCKMGICKLTCLNMAARINYSCKNYIMYGLSLNIFGAQKD